MEKLKRKEAICIATIADALREFRIRGQYANVNMHDDEIEISVYADTDLESRKLKKVLSFFMDEGDKIDIRFFPSQNHLPEFYAVRLTKKFA